MVSETQKLTDSHEPIIIIILLLLLFINIIPSGDFQAPLKQEEKTQKRRVKILSSYMEPPNFHHPQDQFSGYFSSLLSLPPPPPPQPTSINSQDHHHHHLMLSTSNSSNSSYQNYHHQLIDQSSKDHDYSWPAQPPPPSLRSLMNLESFDANELLLSKIKDEMPDAFPKLRDMNIYNNNNNSNNNYFSSTNSGFSSEADPYHHQLYPKSHHHHVMPSINVLNSNLCSSLVSSSSSLDLNLRAVDHHLNHASTTTPSHSTSTTSRNSNMQMMSQHHFMGDSPSHSSNNKTIGIEATVSLGIKKSKRPISSFSDQSSSSKNNTQADDHKKKRSTSRPSCPPLKVRKEKLGDRIASLQRLVAPYGKTDTASVLTEAIGYIQFLHDQVQTLSVPYMRSTSNNQPTRPFMLRSSRDQEDHQYHQHQHQHQSQREDLKSRGLCLVPQSVASYLNGYNLGI